jgi:uncharacterized protein (DUF433 family)
VGQKNQASQVERYFSARHFSAAPNFCEDTYQHIITLEPNKRGGKPCIRGMRITGYDVLSYLAAGMSPKEILDDFPYLTEADILACLSSRQIVNAKSYYL